MSEFKLQRYRQDEDPWGFFLMKEDSNGEWVKWEDVEPLLKAYLALIDERNEALK